MLREDYIIRLIKQLGAFLARIAGKRREGDFEGALDEAGKAWDDLIGQPPRELVDVLDTHTLADLLGEPAKMRVAARLLVEEGRAYAGKGDPAHAAICYRRAWELYLEARVVEPSDEDEAAISELARLVPANQLDPRYRGET
ncbi:MAG TPA: hypothetical protein VFS15_10070 [Kofleriaceae bacterium]|nr:hypothetical protein [Kofleriaceae bacterium]